MMKRYYCDAVFSDEWPSRPVAVYLLSEADAELKRRDEEIAELKLRIAVALKASWEEGSSYERLEMCRDILSATTAQFDQILLDNPEYAPTEATNE